jgi:hypothetical protein
MRTAFLTAWLLCSGCAAGLERDGRCLAVLTADLLEAQTTLARLQASWRAPTSQTVTHWRPDAESPHVDEYRSRAIQTDLDRARVRYQLTVDWYDRIYQRVQTRLDEQQILTEAFWTLVTGPGLLFYPLVYWNTRTVFWDGSDPDAEADPIRQFCSSLAMKPGSGERTGEP